MNELIEHYWNRIVLLIVPYLVFLFLALMPINFYLQTPGGLSEVENLITIDYNQDKVTEGTISSTYIMYLNRSTYFEFILGTLNKYASIGVLAGSNLDYTNNEIIQISYLDKATSVHAAIIVAYQRAALDNSEITIEYNSVVMVYGKAIYLSHYDEISFGDIFIQMMGDNDTVVTGISDISTYTQLSNTYTFTFKNEDDVEYDVDLSKDAVTGLFGITLKTYYLVDQESVFPTYHEQNSNIGGPSGGLLQTLSIYNMLCDEDITQGLKIAGTGTINYDGSVGYIGGVKQKIATAYLNRVDVFFIPYLDPNYYYDNYVEALRACEELGIDPEGWLVPVASFDEAIQYLSGLGE